MTRRPRDPVPPAAQGASHLVRSAEWAGLRPGDAVSVQGVRARGASWEFVAHVRNVRTTGEWVEVVGGQPGKRALRSFPVAQIFPAPRPSARSKRPGSAPASLLDAPRLPF